MNKELELYSLKYGCNPHQVNAKLYFVSPEVDIPFKILNGTPGYINILDAVNSWYLVNEILYSINRIASASFKHVSPAGVAIGETVLNSYRNARECDPKSSFGDFIAINSEVTKELAMYIKTKVSDGIIAPSYDTEALEILKDKKQGKYIVLQGTTIDFNNEKYVEYRRIKKLVITQDNNDYVFTKADLGSQNIVTTNKSISGSQMDDIILSNITLKYTQSNSVCITYNGSTIGIGAGQQSRIDCVKLAKRKAIIYLLRNSIEKDNKLEFIDNIKYQDRVNAVIQYLEDDMSANEEKIWCKLFKTPPKFLTKEQKNNYLKDYNNIALISDGFFPFRDSIDQASMINIKFVCQPGGSVADKTVIEACNEYGMLMYCANKRLFHH
jgi:phosphoribosylaminoimidazolecarboxamide formyltransferase / IMP cyclohydrolase